MATRPTLISITTIASLYTVIAQDTSQCGTVHPELPPRCVDLPRWNATGASWWDGLFAGTTTQCSHEHGHCDTAGTPSANSATGILYAMAPFIECIPTPAKTPIPPLLTEAPPGLCERPRKTKRTVIDVVGVAYEVDVLEIRQAEISPAVDYFFVFESHATQRGNAKPLFYERSRGRFQDVSDRTYYLVDDAARYFNNKMKMNSESKRQDDWINEDSLNSIGWPKIKEVIKEIKDLTPDAVIMFGDLDEFFDRESLLKVAWCEETVVDEQMGPGTIMMYHLNLERAEPAHMPRSPSQAPVIDLFTNHPEEIKKHRWKKVLAGSKGYHLGGCLNPYGQIAKEVSLAEGGGIPRRHSHAEDLVRSPWMLNHLNEKGIRACCADREYPYYTGDRVPHYARENKDRYPHLFPQTSENKACSPHIYPPKR
eukprot:m.339524 g.339524  ORF g.339524 m.339524 type:complete len:425 (+) comp18847_c0_seq1:224-1498(+)